MTRSALSWQIEKQQCSRGSLPVADVTEKRLDQMSIYCFYMLCSFRLLEYVRLEPSGINDLYQ